MQLPQRPPAREERQDTQHPVQVDGFSFPRKPAPGTGSASCKVIGPQLQGPWADTALQGLLEGEEAGPLPRRVKGTGPPDSQLCGPSQGRP